MSEQPKSIRSEVITFLIITFALSTPCYFLIARYGITAETAIYTLGLMWCPGIAALITRFIRQRNLRGLGWGWGKTRYQVWAYFLPGIYNVVLYAVIWLSGLGGISEKFVPTLPEIIKLVLIAVLGTLGSCLNAMGEEIGWRGLLVPQLARLTTFTKASFISGAIWVVWHYPLYLFSNYGSAAGSDFGGNRPPVWYGLICFSISVMCLNFIFNWFRLKSGSVWTAVFLHAAQNQYLQSVLTPLTKDTGFTAYFAGEFGIGLAIVTLIVALILWRRRNELPVMQLGTDGTPRADTSV